MTVVNPKSISGINSITTGSGSDNLLTIHTSDASSTERVRINSSGDVIVGSGITVSPDGDIFATGVTTTGSLVSNGVIKIPDGSTSAPSIAASSDTNSGFYFAGADALGLVVGGSRKLLANSSGITINNGDLSIDDNVTSDDITTLVGNQVSISTTISSFEQDNTIQTKKTNH